MAQEEFVVLLGQDAEQDAPADADNGEFVILLGDEGDTDSDTVEPVESDVSLNLGSDGTIAAAADLYQHLAELDIADAKKVQLVADGLERTDTAFLQVLAYYIKYASAAGVTVCLQGAGGGFKDVASRLGMEPYLVYEG